MKPPRVCHHSGGMTIRDLKETYHMTIIPQKRCKECLKEFPATSDYFYRNKKMADGFLHSCKECRKKQQHLHQEERNHVQNLRRHAQGDEYREMSRNYYRQSRVEYFQQRYIRLQDTYKVQQQTYAKAHPEKGRTKSLNYYARKMSAIGFFTSEDVQKQYTSQRGKCYYCGMIVRKHYHVDHIVPLSRGGSNDPSNIVIACPTCNQRKGNKLPHEWSESGRLL